MSEDCARILDDLIFIAEDLEAPNLGHPHAPPIRRAVELIKRLLAESEDRCECDHCVLCGWRRAK